MEYKSGGPHSADKQKKKRWKERRKSWREKEKERKMKGEKGSE
jgi:hypothetical protein